MFRNSYIWVVEIKKFNDLNIGELVFQFTNLGFPNGFFVNGSLSAAC